MSNETYQSRFQKLSSQFEEWRANTTALYLTHFQEPFEIMYKGRESEWDDIQYTMWYYMILDGLNGLTTYDPSTNTWGESHVAGDFVIMRILYEAGDLVSFEFTTDKKGDETFFVYLNRDKIKTDCHKAIEQFLFKIHILRWTGDYEKGKEFFEGYSTVDEFFLKIRDIVIRNKKPRRLELQGNLFMNLEGKVEYKVYEESHEEIVRSYIERNSDILDVDMLEYWMNDSHKFRIKK